MSNMTDVLIQLRSAGGFYWNTADGLPGSLTYAFSAVNPFPQPADATQSAISTTFSPFLQEQKAAAREAFRLWAEVANITVQEITDQDLADVQLYNAVPRAVLPAAVVDFLVTNPQTGNNRQTPHLTVNRTLPESGNLFVLPGQLGFRTLLHEIGHVLGFKHPGPYAGGGQSVSPPPYLGQGDFAGIPDDQRRTVLSDIAFAPHRAFGVWAATPLLIDIAAAQLIYGANMTTRAGPGDVYQFSALTMDVKAIWDAGGLGDRVDASNQSARVWIDLRPGALSSIGPLGTKTDNVAIAFGTQIEDATGGSGADTLIGNQVANRLEGNAGNDILDGGTAVNAGTGTIPKGQGDGVVDSLVGGMGSDTFILREGGGLDEVNDDGATDALRFHSKQDVMLPFEGLGVPDIGSAGMWHSLDGRWTFELSGSELIVTDTTSGAQGKLLDFANGDFGIRLLDAPTTPQTTRTIEGDYAPAEFTATVPVDYTPEADWRNVIIVETQYDADNNPISYTISYNRVDDIGNYLPGAADPGRADDLNDSSGNDLIQLGGGDDVQDSAQGGDDWVQAGAGRDLVTTGGGKDLIEGGAEGDIVIAGAGNDRVYADVEIALAAAIQAAETDAPQSDARDLLAGGDGDDILVAGATADVMFGGAGLDVIVGGAADDTIYSDGTLVSASLGWTITRTETQLIEANFHRISRLFSPTTAGSRPSRLIGWTDSKPIKTTDLICHQRRVRNLLKRGSGQTGPKCEERVMPSASPPPSCKEIPDRQRWNYCLQ